MPIRVQIPVIGVFYNELDHLDGWLASVGTQSDDRIEPIPVIVVSRHPRHAADFEKMLGGCISRGAIRHENVHIQESNIGPTSGFNLAVNTLSERCRWIASLDPDGRFAPNALRQLYETAEPDERVGMVTPLVVKPRADRNFERPVAAIETVCHAGHYPFQPLRPSGTLTNYRQLHFKNWTVEDVRHFLAGQGGREPFAACFCSSLWSAAMFADIELPDARQFRTLNCGEIGYRARLRDWCARFSPEAFAFHANAPDPDYSPASAIAESGSTAWHYYHAQGLIALKYFPDHLRDIAARHGAETIPWEATFRDLQNVQPYAENDKRQRLFDRWRDFDFRP
jgi:GT2 family glycosyltransferase